VNFTRAIVRPPGRNFACGVTSAAEGAPDYERALHQHARYCDALSACGLELTRLSAEDAYPDGTFVEDAAVVAARGAIVTRPGAPTRTGEIESVARALARFFQPGLRHIDAPGTVDGGDVCEADGHFFIGVSARTNEPGALQLKRHLESIGHSASLVDIRASRTLLHLKTGIAYLGEGVWAVAEALMRDLQPLERFGIRHLIPVRPGEGYAANCVRVNDRVLVASGYPGIAAELDRLGLRPLPLDMSEYRKMDGGLSCLSLRF
jgi:dimethylargininase